MKSRFVLIFMMLFVSASTIQAQDYVSALVDSSDSRDTENARQMRTVPEAPGLKLDLPKDMRIVKEGFNYSIESPEHYLVRRLEKQDKQIEKLKKENEDLTKRLSAVEEKIEQWAAANPDKSESGA